MKTDRQELFISEDAVAYAAKKSGKVVVDYISGDN